MNPDEFRDWSRKAAEWGADYRESLRQRPVRAQTQPGDVLAQLPRHRRKQRNPWTGFSRILRKRSCPA